MTTILAIQGEGWAVIGSDTQWQDDYGRVGRMNQPKIVSVGKYLIGIAGDTRGANIVQHMFAPPALPVKLSGNKLANLMVAQFIPALKECLEKNGAGRPQFDDQPALNENEILVCANGVIFQIDGDYSTEMDTNNLYAIGSGAHYGLGAMQSLVNNRKIGLTVAKTILVKGLNIAAKFDSNSSAPFHTFIQQAK